MGDARLLPSAVPLGWRDGARWVALVSRGDMIMAIAAQPTGTQSGASALGVHSEVGKLRKVMVHRPDLELKRLTPANHDDLLFDDVLWVRRARQQHDMFADLVRDRGTEVVYLEELLAETLAVPEGRKWVLDRAVTPFTVGAGIADEARAYLEEIDATTLADHLIGGLTVKEAQDLLKGRGVQGVGDGQLAKQSLVASAMEPDDFVLRPLPNSY